MTATQALRKGSKEFAIELASLTGSVGGIGPPAAALRGGMQVEVEVSVGGGKNQWFPGKVVAVADQGKKVDVQYTDGTTDEGLNPKQTNIRPIGTGVDITYVVRENTWHHTSCLLGLTPSYILCESYLPLIAQC
jgi:hypothetical protein